MRRDAGSYLRRKMVRLSMLEMARAGILVGLGIGPLFFLAGKWIGPVWSVVAYLATAAAVYFAVRALDRSSFRWNLDNLRRGLDAETRVAQAIEYAITAENCAVAHSVTEIAKVGDIDHIVATPVAIWVIETKYRRVPRKSFPEVLSRIAANTEAVRQWAPAGTTVRGCLVLAYEDNQFKPEARAGNEKIAVYTEKTLGDFRRELRKEARGGQLPDERVATEIWKLGHISE